MRDPTTQWLLLIITPFEAGPASNAIAQLYLFPALAILIARSPTLPE